MGSSLGSCQRGIDRNGGEEEGVCVGGGKVQSRSMRLWNQRFHQKESIEVELMEGLKLGLGVDSYC